MSSVEYETLTIYGFSLDYPVSCKLEFNPKFKREEGDMAIKRPSDYNIFVSWGPLVKLKGKLGNTDAHAEFSLERIGKSVQGKVTPLQRDGREVNGHTAAYNHVRVEVPRRGFIRGKPQYQEIRSLHIHCDRTSRYFVIYGSTAPDRSEEHGGTIERMVASFRCH